MIEVFSPPFRWWLHLIVVMHKHLTVNYGAGELDAKYHVFLW
jgi:hypothetical protein